MVQRSAVKTPDIPIMSPRQEKFCLAYLSAASASEAAISAGYNSDHAKLLMRRPAVIARISELKERQTKAMLQNQVDAAIANVKERKERLTTFVREDLATPEGMLKRGSNIRAIEELNKMERIYETRLEANIDNRTVNIYVVDKEAQKLLSRVNERTGSLIEAPADLTIGPGCDVEPQGMASGCEGGTQGQEA